MAEINAAYDLVRAAAQHERPAPRRAGDSDAATARRAAARAAG